ncbi:hypothetical protein NQ117_15415 [Paenibacillus sp. SC116]|uniref:hypothetical protein n=1 Tax=Paenibacillus sp. SC116 TaxID=2968986 RepID=UPI00215AA5B3|nr:hypothetical protein [Paenibacillus sp. SC116]MCR8845070.1 hypothetical protein [Paenibacillus sp. SC116]
MKYVKPSVLDCGKSEDIIKGDCGWGTEGWTLDETGAYDTQKNRQYVCGYIGNPALGGYTIYCCRSESACSSSNDHC